MHKYINIYTYIHRPTGAVLRHRQRQLFELLSNLESSPIRSVGSNARFVSEVAAGHALSDSAQRYLHGI